MPFAWYVALATLLYVLWRWRHSRTTSDVAAVRRRAVDDASDGATLVIVGKRPPAPLVNQFCGDAQRHIARRLALNGATLQRYKQKPNARLTNWGSHDLFNFAVAPVRTAHRALSGNDAMCDALRQFGAGSCGPRSFYGTSAAHVKFERAVSRWLGFDAALMYSSWRQLVISMPVAFCNGGTLVYDDAVCSTVLEGARAARCRTVSFAHNDADSLAAALDALYAQPDAHKHPVLVYVEGIYRERSGGHADHSAGDVVYSRNTSQAVVAPRQLYGAVCELGAISRVARRYAARGCLLALDDTLAVGLLGRTFRGSLDHHQLESSSVDVLVAGLDAAFASNASVCVSSHELTAHQRTHAPGFTFSAAPPPAHAAVAHNSLELIQQPRMHRARVTQLTDACDAFLTALANMDDSNATQRKRRCKPTRQVELFSSPVFHLYLKGVGEKVCLTRLRSEAEETLRADSSLAYTFENTLEAVSRHVEHEYHIRIPRVLVGADARDHVPSLRLVVRTDTCRTADIYTTLLAEMQRHANSVISRSIYYQ